MRLKLHLRSSDDFVKYFDVGAGELFLPGSEGPNVGEHVTIEVVFQGGPRVPLRGLVKWRRSTGDKRTRVGTGIDVAASEQSKLNYIFGYIRGGLMDVRERRRLPVRLRVAYLSPAGRRINFTRDLNEEGGFVRAAELLPVGANTTLTISPPGGFRPLEVNATVTRHQTDASDRGIGVRFEFGSPDERTRWEAFVHKLESEYLDGNLPDEVLIDARSRLPSLDLIKQGILGILSPLNLLTG